MRQFILSCLLASAAALAAAGPARANPPLAGDIFRTPDMESATLSPDGERLVYMRRLGRRSPSVQIYVIDLTQPGMVSRRIAHLDFDAQWVRWGGNGRIVIALSQRTRLAEGLTIVSNSAGRLFLTDHIEYRFALSLTPDGRDPVVLYNPEGRQLEASQRYLDDVVDFLPNDPDHVLLAVRHANRSSLDLHRVNLITGQAERIERGQRGTIAWFTNGDGRAVMRFDVTRSFREIEVLARRPGESRWRSVAQRRFSDFSQLQEGVTWVARSERHDEALVTAQNPDTGTTGLYRFDLETGRLSDPIFSVPDYDIEAVQTDPLTARPVTLTWSDERRNIVSFDPVTDAHLAPLEDFFGDDVSVLPIQRAGANILLLVTGPQEPGSYFVYDHERRQVEPVGPANVLLQASALGQVSVHRYQARDQTQLFGYLTRPAQSPPGPGPLVVLPHGGPESRDHYEFDALAQLFAAAGLTVFQPQFRGSYGFGDAFRTAGHGQWGGLIQSDITDGVQDLIDAGIADPERICVAGWSFGGYAALMQTIANPELYQCAAAGAAVTDLEVMLEWAEDRQRSRSERLRSMLGADDRRRMETHSPAGRADEITVPVLLVHGVSDNVVPIEQSRIMADALEDAGADVRFDQFRGGHHFTDPEAIATTMRAMQRFVASHLASDPPAAPAEDPK
jgi:dipeptidyl aminopeptidase/acylaminoacyl peptidase